MIDWPKIIKLDDVADALDTLDERVATLELLVARNDQRITALEVVFTHHEAGAVERQAELDRLEATLERFKWAARTGRKP